MEAAVEIADKYACRLQNYRGENWYAFLPEESGKTQAICGTGAAVSNAVSEVKAVADYVTLSNDEDGVADWIEKIYLQSKQTEITNIFHEKILHKK